MSNKGLLHHQTTVILVIYLLAVKGDIQINVILSSLFVENRCDLGFDFSQPEFFALDLNFVANLVLGEAK